MHGSSTGPHAYDHWRVQLDPDGLVCAVEPADNTLRPQQPFVEALHSSEQVAWAAAVADDLVWVGERFWRLADGRVVIALLAGPGTLELIDVTVPLASRDHAGELKRRKAVADVAWALARELNDPVSVVLGRLELLGDLPLAAPETIARHVGIALGHARRLADSVRSLRQLDTGATTGTTRLSDVVAAAKELLGRRASQVSVSIRPASVRVDGGAAPYIRALTGVLAAAVERTPIAVQVEVRVRRDGDRLQLEVHGQAATPGSRHPALVLSEAVIDAHGGAMARVGAASWRIELPAPPPRRRVVRGGHAVAWGDAAFASRVQVLLEATAVTVTAGSAVEDIRRDVRLVVVDATAGTRPGWGVARDLVARRPDLAGRVLLVGVVRAAVPSGVRLVRPPLRRATLVDALLNALPSGPGVGTALQMAGDQG